jgi:hypothetical protein
MAEVDGVVQLNVKVVMVVLEALVEQMLELQVLVEMMETTELLE